MRVHILGVRGSTPAPGADFARVGGHTSCVAIAADDGPPTLVLDAGTGIRGLDRLLGGEPFRGTLALTHLHWDHVMGLPFATAIDRPDAEARMLVPSEGADPAALLSPHAGPALLPGRGRRPAGAPRRGRADGGAGARRAASSLESRWLPHGRGRALGFRVEDRRRALAYIPDHGPDGVGADALALCREADLMLHDGHFIAGEEAEARAAGHSTVAEAVALARAAGARRLLLTHHHPARTDGQVERLAVGVGGARAGGGRRPGGDGGDGLAELGSATRCRRCSSTSGSLAGVGRGGSAARSVCAGGVGREAQADARVGVERRVGGAHREAVGLGLGRRRRSVSARCRVRLGLGRQDDLDALPARSRRGSRGSRPTWCAPLDRVGHARPVVRRTGQRRRFFPTLPRKRQKLHTLAP